MKILPGVLSLLLCPLFLHAAPLEKNTLPAGTAWAVHLDLAQCRAVFPPLDKDGNRLPADAPLARLLAQISSATGFDLLEQGESLTLCGNGHSSANRLWLRLPDAPQKLAAALAKNPSAASTLQRADRTFCLVSLGDNATPQLIWLTPVAPDLLLVTAEEKAIAPQIALLKNPPQEISAASFFPAPPADTWFCAALDATRLRQQLPASPFARDLTHAALFLSGNHDTVRIDARLQTASPGTAARLFENLQTFSFASLRIEHPPLAVQDDSLTFSGNISRADLLAQLPRLAEETTHP